MNRFMKREIATPYGKLRIGSQSEIFAHLVDAIETAVATYGDPFTVGLTGGSTPKAFYRWAIEKDAISQAIIDRAVWCVSDERMVPLDHEESNFGNADRAFLTPLGVSEARKFPWPVSVDPHSAAPAFEMKFHERFGETRAFDICFLGMGEYGHTASIFPQSPLLVIESGSHFAPVQVPGKGWRLSITPDGLAACGKIFITVTGESKAGRLRAVINGEGDYPAQILGRFPGKVEWLVDEAAGALL